MRIIFFIFLIIGITQNLHAQKLHAFIFCNTSDKTIGSSAKKNLDNMLEFVQRISTGLDYPLVPHIIKNGDLNRQKVEQVINDGMNEVTKLDIIIVYFNTHGYKSTEDIDPFPQLDINGDLMSSFEIHKQICKIDHWLLLTLIDACSEYKQLDPQDSFLIKSTFTQANDKIMTDLASSKVSNYNFRAFLNRTGSFIVSAGQAGALTWASSEGSFFTTNFIRAFYEEMDTANHLVSWERLLNKASDYTYRITKHFPTQPFPIWSFEPCGPPPEDFEQPVYRILSWC